MEVEDQVAYPAATGLLTLPGVRHVSTIARRDGAVIAVSFADSSAAPDNRRALLRAPWTKRMPAGAVPALATPADPSAPVAHYVLSSATLDATALRRVQDLELRMKLLRLPGVAELVTCGETRNVRVDVDHTRAAAFGLGLGQLIDAISAARVSIRPGARSDQGLTKLASLVIHTTPDAVPVRLSDVARVRLGSSKRCTATRNDGPVVDVRVLQVANADSRVAPSIRRAIADLIPRLAEQGITLTQPRAANVRVDVTLADMGWSVSMERAQHVASRVSKQLRTLDGVAAISTQVGRSDASLPVGARGRVWLLIEAATGTDTDDLARRVETSLRRSATTATVERLDAHGRTVARSCVQIYGTDLDQLRRLAGRVISQLEKVEGLHSIVPTGATEQPALVIAYNRKAAARYGVSITDVARSVRAATGGVWRSIAISGRERVPLRISVAHVTEPQHFLRLPVRTASGAMVPLSQLVAIELRDQPAEILSRDGQRYVAIRYHGPTAASARSALRKAVTATVELPPGYAMSWNQRPCQLIAP